MCESVSQLMFQRDLATGQFVPLLVFLQLLRDRKILKQRCTQPQPACKDRGGEVQKVVLKHALKELV